MSARMPIVWSDAHVQHAPRAELWVGVATPPVELPERAVAIRAELEGAGHPVVAAAPQPDAALAAVHDPALLEYLAGAWRQWDAAGLRSDPGQEEVVPYFFAHAELLGAAAPALPAAAWARPGRFAFDTMTPIGRGTWAAARGAADAALTAAALVLAGAPAAYACCRPPGHHATRAGYGGACYLNNAAIAAERLRAALGAPVALIDVDAHHGNGAQAIFAATRAVVTGSVHVDPGAGWFPHFLGFDGADGALANRNVALAPGSGDPDWVGAVSALVAWAREHGPRALVVALGVDAAAGDPESPLRVTADGYRAGGRALGALGLPTVVVQEGGYDLAAIGPLVRAALEGIQDGLAAAGRGEEPGDA
jgi:acetoin utilization deacetylase AcuC-like enzyme